MVAIVVPAKRLETPNIIALLLRMTLVTVKKRSIVKNKGTKLARASLRLDERIADINSTRPKRSTGKSKGVVLSLTLPSIIIRILNTTKESVVVTAKRTCFGRENASVNSVVNRRGKAKRVIPSKNKDTFSKYDRSSRFELFMSFSSLHPQYQTY